MSEKQGQSTFHDDEISLKELILKIKEFWDELWKYWWIIALFVLPILGFKLYQHFNTPNTYSAKLTFMVNDDEGQGGLGGMASVLGSFGLGGGAGGEYNLEKMLQLLKSRKIVQTVLLSKKEIDGKNDFYGNHFIRLYKYHESWTEDTTGLKDYLFLNDKVDSFGRADFNVLKILHSRIIGNPDKGIPALLESSISETTGIMALDLNTESEQLSMSFVEDIFDELSNYYIKKSTEKQYQTFRSIELKADSLEAELHSNEFALAKFMDNNRGLYNKTDQLNQLRLEGKVRMLATAWAKVVEQKEMAEFSLRNKTPVIQPIDYPIPPLKPDSSSLIKTLIISILLGGFIGSAYIIGRKIFRDVML